MSADPSAMPPIVVASVSAVPFAEMPIASEASSCQSASHESAARPAMKRRTKTAGTPDYRRALRRDLGRSVRCSASLASARGVLDQGDLVARAVGTLQGRAFASEDLAVGVLVVAGL